MHAARPIPFLVALLLLVSALGTLTTTSASVPAGPPAPASVVAQVTAATIIGSDQSANGFPRLNFTINITWNDSTADTGTFGYNVWSNTSAAPCGSANYPLCPFTNGNEGNGTTFNPFFSFTGGRIPGSTWSFFNGWINESTSPNNATWQFAIAANATVQGGFSCIVTVNASQVYLQTPGNVGIADDDGGFNQCGPTIGAPAFVRATTQGTANATTSSYQVVQYVFPPSVNDAGTGNFTYAQNVTLADTALSVTPPVITPLAGTLSFSNGAWSQNGQVLVAPNGMQTVTARFIAVNLTTHQQSLDSCQSVILVGPATGIQSQCPNGGVDASIPLNPTLPFIDVNATANITGWTPEIVSLVFLAGFAVAVTMIAWTMGPFAVAVGLVLTISLFMAQGVVPSWVYVLLFTSALAALVYLKRTSGGGSS